MRNESREILTVNGQSTQIFYSSITASSSGASFFAWQRRAQNEWLVMNRKGPWEGYRRLLPAFLCAHIFIKRETSGYEADSITSLDGRARKEIEITGARLTDVTTVRRPDMNQLKFKYTLTQDKRFYMTAVGEHFDTWAHSRSEHMTGDSWRPRLSDEGCLHEFKKGQRLWEVVQFGCDGCWGLGRESYMCCVKLTEENTVRRDRKRKILRRVLLDSGSQADRN